MADSFHCPLDSRVLPVRLSTFSYPHVALDTQLPEVRPPLQ